MWRNMAGLLLLATLLAAPAAAEPRFSDHYAHNGPVKIHYTAAGKGPLVVLIHGFPDSWNTWRPLMDALDEDWRVVAMDLRGYNLSDKPKGVEAYRYEALMGDIAAVIRAEGAQKATIVGHDWGGGLAWRFASDHPDMVERLVVLSTPHPAGMVRELATNPEQQRNSQYARNFQKEGAEAGMNAEQLAGWIRDPAHKARQVEALKRSDFTAMLNYYRANYPASAEAAAALAPQVAAMGKIKAPTLILHGRRDTSLMAAGHNGAWEQIEADTTIVMVPNAGHFVQADAPELVNRTIKDWLAARAPQVLRRVPDRR